MIVKAILFGGFIFVAMTLLGQLDFASAMSRPVLAAIVGSTAYVLLEAVWRRWKNEPFF